MRLKAYFRLQRGNRQRLAETVGLTPVYLSQIAGGSKTPSLPMAQAIRDATGGEVDYDDLLPDKTTVVHQRPVLPAPSAIKQTQGDYFAI